MIYTLTLNPAIDVSLHVKDGLMPGSINKSYAMRSDPGGKGINVSKNLKTMGKESVVCVGVCGEDGEKLLSKLKTEFEVISVVYPSGNTRTNIKISGENGVTTDINAEGPYYDKASVDTLKNMLSERLTDGDIVVISGRPPLGSPSEIYADLIRIKLCTGIAHRTDDTSPVCVVSADCGLDQAGSYHRLCQYNCLLMGLRAFDLYLKKGGRTFPVSGYHPAEADIHCTQSLAKCAVIFIFLCNQCIACFPVRK